MKAIVSAPFWFEAAHHSDDYPEGHPNRRIHGHSYRLIVSIEGEVNPRSGYVIDHDDLVVAMKPLVSELDHNYINKIPGLEVASSENIAAWVWKKLKPQFPGLCRIDIERPSVGMTATYLGN